ncbi:oxidoreductase, Gfo/Idh/MocA family/transferase hexapeptide repeat protein [invertebrate metagenome]|uniref:Oxidoreductase, Gfo/Idh/MocA family/transferase hexapeptide repeat protein n=1 Tax=invertebrate metagenome TaxID=1711999 RepID=A0A484H6Z8_9ZZZZ
MTVQSSIRLGLIGAGRRGRAIIKAIDRTTSAHLVRVGSHKMETSALVSSSCQIFPDWHAILDPVALDGLIIATPPATHFSIASHALAAKIPTLIEIPLSTTLEHAIALKKLTSPPLAIVNHTLLTHPAYRFIKELVRGHTIGPIRAIRSYFGAYCPDSPVLWNWGAQELALCVDLLNASEPEDISARYIRRHATLGGSGETVELRLDFVQDTDVEVRIRLSNILEQKTHYFAVYFDRLTLVYDGSDSGTLKLHPPIPDFSVPDDTGQPVVLPMEDSLFNTISWFVVAVANRVEDTESLDLGVDVVALLERCQSVLE